MAIRVYTGASTTTAKQVETYTIGGLVSSLITSGQTFTITLKYEGSTPTDVVSYSNTSVEVTSALAPTIASKITSLCQESTKNRFKKVVFTVDAEVITATAATAGEPFYATVACTPTTALVTAAQTAENKGPSDWNDVSNWGTGVVPVTNDEVMIDTDQDISYGLGQSSVALNFFHVQPGSTGRIGNRDHYLQIGMTAGNQKTSAFSGTGEAFVDFGEGKFGLCTVFNTAAASDSSNSGLHLLATATSSLTLDIRGGDVGLATFSGESSHLKSVIVSEPGAVSSKFRMGDGVSTITNVDVSAGTAVMSRSGVAATITAMNVQGGTVVLEGNKLFVTTLNQYGGTIYADNINSESGITTLNIYAGTFDTTRAANSRDIDALNIWPGGTFLRAGDGVTIGAGQVVNLQDVGAQQVTVAAI